MPGLETDPAQPGVPIFTRTLEIGPSTVELIDASGLAERSAVCLAGDRAGASLSQSRRDDRAERAAVRDRRGSSRC